MINRQYLTQQRHQNQTVRADRIVVESGALWLTQSGCADDVFLVAGESYSSHGEGRIVIEALCDNTRTCLQLNHRSARRKPGIPDWLTVALGSILPATVTGITTEANSTGDILS